MRDRVLFFTDLHFWEVVWNPLLLLNKRLLGNANVFFRRRHHFPMANAQPFAIEALKTGARTILIGGDLTSTATEAEFRMACAFLQFLEDQGARILLVQGNHDVYTFEAVRRRRFERHLARWAPPEGYPCRRDLDGGTPVILTPTVCPNLVSSRGRISAEEVQVVQDLIAATPAGPVLVLGHYPLLRLTEAYELTENRSLRGDEQLRRVLGESGRQVLYVSGHVHRYSSTPDPEHPGLRHVTGPALFNHWPAAGREGGFLEIDCDGQGFGVRHHWKAEGDGTGAWRSESAPIQSEAEPR